MITPIVDDNNDNNVTNTTDDDIIMDFEDDPSLFDNETEAPTTVDDFLITEEPSETNYTDNDEIPDDDIDGEDETLAVDCEEIYRIRTERDCRRVCDPFRYNILYTTRETENATGVIRLSYDGFRCQCLEATTQIDCVYTYKFPTCNDVGIISCNPASSSIQPITPRAADTAADADDGDETAIKDNLPTNVTTTTTTKPYIITSCGEYCGILGFEEDLSDNNGNENDHLCTINEVMTPNWISCACGVDIGLDGGQTLSITDGFYVCGDPGFEVGLNFARGGGSGASTISWTTITSYFWYMSTVLIFAVLL